MHAASLRARFLVALGLAAAPLVYACEPPLEAKPPPPEGGDASPPPLETIAPPGDGTANTNTANTANTNTANTANTTTTTATATATVKPAVLALPAELSCPPPPPPPPPGKFVPQGGCNVQVMCRAPLAEVPVQHYPAPFEKCSPEGHGGFGLSFSAGSTKAMRAQKQPDLCCYRQMQLHPAGRPLRIEGQVALAPLGPGAGWCAPARASRLDPARRAAVARHFRAVAAVEHASVASFARTSLQLLALGAPADLLGAVHEAARDEIAHAAAALALASDDAPLAPGAYPAAVAPIEASFAALVHDTVLDGCLGETMGALEATAAAERCVDADIRAFLLRVAEDEARHAELAYRILAWALASGGEEAARALGSARDELGAAVDARGDDALLEGFGGLRAEDRAGVLRAARDVVARPCLDALLAA